MKIHVINGPNLNLLGKREPEVYGSQTFDDVLSDLRKQFPNVQIEYFQSNHEGAIIDELHRIGFGADGIVMNAGAYTHTSVAIADAIAAISTPVIEVHISNIHARESFRHHSFMAAYCKGSVVGLGVKGYALAIQYFAS